MSAIEIFKLILLTLLTVCAVAVSFNKNILASIVIYTSYSLVMCVIWILLESPDLAITEAAVGAGITSLLFYVTLKKIRMMANPGGSESSDEEESEKKPAPEDKPADKWRR